MVIFAGFLSVGIVMAKGQTDAKPAGPVTIDFVFSVGGNPQKVTLDLVEKFNKSQNEVVVEGSYGGSYEDATKKLLASLVAGDVPVVAHIAMARNTLFITEGHLENLSKYITEDPELNENDYVKGLLELNRYNGIIYGLPFNCSNPVIYYNRDLFKAAGLDPDKPPVTWDEFYEYAKKISALGPDIYGVNIERGSGWLGQAYTWQFGGQWIAKDNSTVLWTESGAVEALRFMQKMYNEKIAAYQGGNSLSYSNQVGMTMESTGALSGFLELANYDVGVAPMPYKVKRQVPTGGGSLYIFKNLPQEKKDGAWKFLKFMTNAENQMLWAETTGYQAASVGAVNSPTMQALWGKDPRYAVTYKQLEYAVSENNTYIVPFNQVRDQFNAAWDDAILNNVDPGKRLAAAQEEANRILAENRK
jgi:sn-glycerol 3-phosphate transport system substrate-binding protein